MSAWNCILQSEVWRKFSTDGRRVFNDKAYGKKLQRIEIIAIALGVHAVESVITTENTVSATSRTTALRKVQWRRHGTPLEYSSAQSVENGFAQYLDWLVVSWKEWGLAPYWEGRYLTQCQEQTWRSDHLHSGTVNGGEHHRLHRVWFLLIYLVHCSESSYCS